MGSFSGLRGSVSLLLLALCVSACEGGAMHENARGNALQANKLRGGESAFLQLRAANATGEVAANTTTADEAGAGNFTFTLCMYTHLYLLITVR